MLLVIAIGAFVGWVAPVISGWVQQQVLVELERLAGAREVCFVDPFSWRGNCVSTVRDFAIDSTLNSAYDIASAMRSR